MASPEPQQDNQSNRTTRQPIQDDQNKIANQNFKEIRWPSRKNEGDGQKLNSATVDQITSDFCPLAISAALIE